MRVLDEVADAIQKARNRRPHPVLLSVKLEDQFDGTAIIAVRWKSLQRRLDCRLPPMDFDQGHWFLPDGLVTIWDLCKCVALSHPDWELPPEETPAAWKNAQIFAVVRRELVDVCNLEPKVIVRSARPMSDLGMGC